jgi:hypothetical protein
VSVVCISSLSLVQTISQIKFIIKRLELNMRNNQKTLILQRLNETGSVSRNWCLRNYISRLGAIIQRLEEEGYQFSAGYVEDKELGYKDYVYTLLLTPEEDKELTEQKRLEDYEQGRIEHEADYYYR